ncbi:MAG: cyclic nucleotide-binding domain-containing protein, partial [Magnetococcales bacterium]|nr:cyclic nucleotide-binding domain-containing protein [Magnetococcales bacterium]
PNAILLSDVMLQNGQFSNLAEFPVLQMFYRQGMLLPNHPNNTGQMPIIMGLSEQVDAQMQYIFRGNYGLISEEEMIAAGATEEEARTMLRMKLRFAFGAIRPTEDLIDSIAISDQPTEVRNGVSIEREKLNVYRIHYEDESVSVNLNLPPQVNYESPYPLGYHKIKREYFSVLHCGDGDGWDINRPTMSSVLMHQGNVYLIDAGPNIHFSLNALGIGINEVKGIFHTHSHDDHFTGLTTLIRADHRIKYYATPLVRASVTKKLCALLDMDESHFSSYFDVHDLEFDVWNDIDGLEVMPLFSPHPVETNILYFRTLWEEGKHLSYAHLADIVALNVLEDMIEEDLSKPGVTRAFYETTRERYFIPVDLKKLDAGGGMIHGQGEDFREDRSKKLVLSHTSGPLSKKEKEIGATAPFGIMDVLIPDVTNHLRKVANDFLRAYFPTAARHYFRKLLNNRILTFTPGSAILKEGENHSVVHLILTGAVERIQSREQVINTLNAGALIGDYSGLHNIPSTSTCRAVSFVQTLRIPCSLYLEFVKGNKLYTQIERLHENREFLEKNWLFGESLSYPTQNRIARAMRLRHFYKAGEEISLGSHNRLHIIRSGSVESLIGEEELLFQILHAGDFYSEECVIGQPPSHLRFRTREPVTLYEIPRDVLTEIPIVRWKLFETNQKRRQYLAGQKS